MSKIILSILLSLITFIGLTQQYNTLEKQIEFCGKEVENLELELANYKLILEKQQVQITSLKRDIISKEEDKKSLNEKIVDLESASVVLLKVGTTLESQDKLIEALDIFKLITEIYPGTLESSAANFKIKKIHEILRGRASVNNIKKGR